MEEGIIWSAEARTDLRRIFKYLNGAVNKEYAERCIAGYLRSIESLAKHPTKGTITIKRENIRRLKLDRHNFVLYGVVAEGIEVKNILPYRLQKQRF